jgi:pimeloyl-ACP methyl ester carboxylesterase
MFDEALNVSQWVVTGHSLGGLVAQLVHMKRPDVVGITFNPLGGRIMCYHHDIQTVEEPSPRPKRKTRWGHEDEILSVRLESWEIRPDTKLCTPGPPPRSYVFAHAEDLVYRFGEEMYHEHGGHQMAAFHYLIDSTTATTVDVFRASSDPKTVAPWLRHLSHAMTGIDPAMIRHYERVHNIEGMIWTLYTKHREDLPKGLRVFPLMHLEDLVRMRSEGRLTTKVRDSGLYWRTLLGGS